MENMKGQDKKSTKPELKTDGRQGFVMFMSNGELGRERETSYETKQERWRFCALMIGKVVGGR